MIDSNSGAPLDLANASKSTPYSRRHGQSPDGSSRLWLAQPWSRATRRTSEFDNIKLRVGRKDLGMVLSATTSQQGRAYNCNNGVGSSFVSLLKEYESDYDSLALLINSIHHR